jgi:hypothetical protein
MRGGRTRCSAEGAADDGLSAWTPAPSRSLAGWVDARRRRRIAGGPLAPLNAPKRGQVLRRMARNCASLDLLQVRGGVSAIDIGTLDPRSHCRHRTGGSRDSTRKSAWRQKMGATGLEPARYPRGARPHAARRRDPPRPRDRRRRRARACARSGIRCGRRGRSRRASGSGHGAARPA